MGDQSVIETHSDGVATCDHLAAEPHSREELAQLGIVGVNPDLAARLLAYGYADSPAA